MNNRLTWSQIKELFEGQWVELVDFEWDWNRAYPKHARVRNFASDRSVLISKINNSPLQADSVVLYTDATEFMVRHDASSVNL